MVKEGGADVVKLEGAGRMLSRVRAIADSNIGIMGHVGLTPQSATKLGGFKAQGRTAGAAKQLFDDALALQEAGAFAIVLEAVPAPVARARHRGPGRADDRDRRGRRRPTGRCSSGTTCSGCTPDARHASSSATRTSRSEIGDAVAHVRRGRAHGGVPGGEAHLRHLPEELERFEEARQSELSATKSTTGSAR